MISDAFGILFSHNHHPLTSSPITVYILPTLHKHPSRIAKFHYSLSPTVLCVKPLSIGAHEKIISNLSKSSLKTDLHDLYSCSNHSTSVSSKVD